jgi:hypothetical protein
VIFFFNMKSACTLYFYRLRTPDGRCGRKYNLANQPFCDITTASRYKPIENSTCEASVRELVFLIEETDKGGFTAQAIGESIFTDANGFDELKSNIIEAVETHLEPEQFPIRIRYRFGKVRTSSLIGYLAAIYAWMCELCVVLLHLFTNAKLDTFGHIALLTTSIVLSAFAWRRRRDFRALRESAGRIALTTSQMVIVSVFVVALGCLGTAICIRLFGR